MQKAYTRHYAHEYFIRLLPDACLPGASYVAGSNFADISFHYDDRSNKIKLLCAIDNLGKGAAAQAIQALNLMAGLPENQGLCLPGLTI